MERVEIIVKAKQKSKENEIWSKYINIKIVKLFVDQNDLFICIHLGLPSLQLVDPGAGLARCTSALKKVVFPIEEISVYTGLKAFAANF